MPSPRTTTGRRKDRPPRPTPAFAAEILDRLETLHPEARCALEYRTPFELLVATILSAQCTDQRVNQVTPALFDRYPTPAALAEAEPTELEMLIRSTGFFHAKAKSLMGCARALVERHGGELPRTHAEMVRLPGVGRKTASVVLGHAFDIAEGIAVDTHVLRVTNRLGLAHSPDPEKVEAQLMALIPRERWTRTTDLIIFHGRKVCDARRPACGACTLFDLCRWDGKQAHASPAAKAPRSSGKARPPRMKKTSRSR